MTETNNDHMEESLWEVEHFLAQENIDKDLLNEAMIDDMAYHYYKNYNYYDMMLGSKPPVLLLSTLLSTKRLLATTLKTEYRSRTYPLSWYTVSINEAR